MPVSNPISALRRAAKNSPWLVMSILAHTILLVWLGLLVVQGAKKDEVEPKTFVVAPGKARDLAPPPIPELVPIDRTPPPIDQRVELIPPDTVIYQPDVFAKPDEDLTKDIGNPDSLDAMLTRPEVSSSSIGVGDGRIIGDGPTSKTNYIRPDFKDNRPIGDGTHGRPPTAHGKTIDKAVRDGLLWLCRHQNKDGSWGARSMRERCRPDAPCFDPKLQANDHYDEGLTGLALLAFLGAGISNNTQADLVDALDGKRYDVGDVVKRGLLWLRSRQSAEGSFSKDRAFMYNEALATMAMSEAYGMTQNPTWRDPAQRGVEFLQRAQRPNPSGQGRWGWRYSSREDVEDFQRGTGDEAYRKELFDSDTSVTAWCVMALKSAELCKLNVEKESMDGALAFCAYATANDGLVGYLDAKGAGQIVTGPYSDNFTYHTTTMSALGMCIRIFGAHDANDPFLVAAAQRIVADLPTISKDLASIDYYYWYYASLALYQLDGETAPRRTGKFWNPWNKAMVDTLIALQEQRKGSCSEGGWLVTDRWGSYSGAGPLYDTALNVLTLEVTFRYPNAFGAKLR